MHCFFVNRELLLISNKTILILKSVIMIRILLLSIFPILIGCSSPKKIKEYLIDTKYNQPIAGYRSGVLFEMGEIIWYTEYLEKCIYTDSLIDAEGIILDEYTGFRIGIDSIHHKLESIGIHRYPFDVPNSRYRTSKGIQIGDPASKVRAKYGKPLALYVPAWNWMFNEMVPDAALIYNGIYFNIDAQSNTVKSIIIYDYKFLPDLTKPIKGQEELPPPTW